MCSRSDDDKTNIKQVCYLSILSYLLFVLQYSIDSVNMLHTNAYYTIWPPVGNNNFNFEL